MSDHQTPSKVRPPRSLSHLTHLLQRTFDKREASRKETCEETEAKFRPFRNLAKGDPDIAKASKKAQERAAKHVQPPEKLARDVHKRKLQSQDFHPNAVRTTPFDWDWTWQATSGSAQVGVTADKTSGDLGVQAYSGDNGGAGSTATAVGFYFQPDSANGILFISSTPSFSYGSSCGRFLDGVHAGGFIGLYVGEYTLGGDFVQAVVDQQIQLWNQTSDSDANSSSSGYGLIASPVVDSDHFYEIWVWAGDDAEGVGSGFLNWSFAGDEMTVNVPEISFSLFSEGS